MGQDAKQNLGAASCFAAPGQRRTQAAFVAGEHAFGLPALGILSLEEAAAHLAPVFGLRPFTPAIAFVDGDDRAADAQFFPAEAMVVLGVVTLVSEHLVRMQMGGGLPDGCGKLR